MEPQHLGEIKYIVGKAPGPRHLLLGSGRSWGQVSPAMGGLDGEPGLRGKAPFPSTERHVIYTEKEQEIMAGRWEGEGGANSCSQGFSGGRGKNRAAANLFSPRSEQIARNKSFPGLSSRLGCLLLFLFYYYYYVVQ